MHLRRFYIPFNSIQYKILLSFVSITILSLSCFGLISHHLSKQSLEEQISLSKIRNLELVTEKLDIMMDNLISLSNIYFGSSELRYLLMSPTVRGSYEQSLTKEFVNRMIVNYKYAFTWLDYHVSIFGFNGVELHSLYEGKVGLQNLTGQAWYEEVQAQNGNVYLLSDASTELASAVGEDHYISVARMLKDYESGENIGLLVISVKESFIFNQIKSSIEEYETIVLTDATGKVLTASDKSLLGTTILNESYTVKPSASKAYYSAEVDGQQQLVSYYHMPKTAWNVYIFSPHDKIFEKMNRVQWYNWILFFLIIGLCIILTYIISRRLTVPIKALYRDMNKVEKGDMSIRSNIDSKDEIGFLAYRFNRMVSRIQQLHNEVISQQEKKRRAELEALQSQINTHFLFNTLTSIRYMVVTGDAQQADSVIVSLVKLLRKTFARKSEFVLIKEELEHLKHYLIIQKARLQNSFTVTWAVDEHILQFRMLTFLLQPIVENALFHGIEPLKKLGHVEIKGYEQKGYIYFEITDNGIGPQGDTIEDTFQGTGTGLQNIRNRLYMHFGPDAGVTIERIDQKFTKTTLYFPLFRNEKELLSGEHHSSR